MKISILHVEDEPAITQLVQMAFEAFGFQGAMISTNGVASARALLRERSRKGKPFDLVLVDMQLPDGTGLDVLREVKADPLSHLTPVLVLSGEIGAGVVNEAYALGANCYFPKGSRNVMKSLKALYECWVESAILPLSPSDSGDRVEKALTRVIRLRARTSDFFLRLANATDESSQDMNFWLENSLDEGNLSNLLAFFNHKISDKDVPPEITDRLGKRQERAEQTLESVETRFRDTVRLDVGETYQWALDLTEQVDEEIFAENLGYLFPKSPAATMALKERASAHFRRMADHILERAENPGLRRRAEKLLKKAGRMSSRTFESKRSSGAGQRIGR